MGVGAGALPAASAGSERAEEATSSLCGQRTCRKESKASQLVGFLLYDIALNSSFIGELFVGISSCSPGLETKHEPKHRLRRLPDEATPRRGFQRSTAKRTCFARRRQAADAKEVTASRLYRGLQQAEADRAVEPELDGLSSRLRDRQTIQLDLPRRHVKNEEPASAPLPPINAGHGRRGWQSRKMPATGPMNHVALRASPWALPHDARLW